MLHNTDTVDFSVTVMEERIGAGPHLQALFDRVFGADCRFSRSVWRLPDEQVSDWVREDPVTHTRLLLYAHFWPR